MNNFSLVLVESLVLDRAFKLRDEASIKADRPDCSTLYISRCYKLQQDGRAEQLAIKGGKVLQEADQEYGLPVIDPLPLEQFGLEGEIDAFERWTWTEEEEATPISRPFLAIEYQLELSHPLTKELTMLISIEISKETQQESWVVREESVSVLGDDDRFSKQIIARDMTPAYYRRS